MTPAELEKHLRWCRTTATDLFWASFQRWEGQPLESWKCFEQVHQAATTTAIKFMAMAEKSMKLTSVVKCGDLSFEVFPFLCKNLAGLILASYKKHIRFSVVEEIFQQFYECGFRAWMCLNDKGDGDQDCAMDTSTTSSLENCEGCSESPCVCHKLTALFKETNL